MPSAHLEGHSEVPSMNLVSPASMAYDDCTGELFVAEIQTGKIVGFELW